MSVLTKQEREILRALYQRKGQVVPYDVLIPALGMRRPSRRPKLALKVTISMIRRKMPVRIDVALGQGYALHVGVASA